MNYKSLQAKIIIIFSIPMLALIYFSYSFAVSKYQQLELSKAHVLSANATNTLTDLIHNLQSERGLSAGYLVSQNLILKKKLQTQYIRSDLSYENYLKYCQKSQTQQELLQKFLPFNPQKKQKHISAHFKKIQEIREKVLNQKLNLHTELEYYSLINKELMQNIDLYVSLLNGNQYINNSFSQLQNLQEIAGLQRAYIFSNILKQNFSKSTLLNVQELETKLNLTKENFQLLAPSKAKVIYNSILQQETRDKLEDMKRKFFQSELQKEKAQIWFTLSSLYIDQLHHISQLILKNSIITATNSEEDAKKILYLSAASWIFSILAYLFFLYIINKLLNKEKKLLEKLRISSYIFDSHEAMVLTSPKGLIIQVNGAFTSITGYSEEEAIGKSVNLLKSFKHSEDFYKNMWKRLKEEGKWSDEIYNKRKNGEIYLERLSITAIKDDQGTLINYIAHFLDISDLKKAQERAEHQADHDFLTGLFNRKALMKRLHEESAKAQRHKFTHAFLFMDLDHFKAVNDTYGHAMGDKLLLEVTNRVQSLLREEDIFSRISGDEFTIIMLNLDNKRPTAALQVKEKCNTIIENLSKEFFIDENSINISASIGIKIFPNKEESIEDVISHADTAMYQAKANGKNRYTFFDKNIEVKLKELARLEEELLKAIQNKEFTFYLQPKIDIQTNTICGAEALVRWQHPSRGLLFPNDFLEVASKMGLIPSLTKLALQSVCQFLHNYKDWQGIVSININATELLNPEFEASVLGIINSYSINPEHIELEILEDDLIEDIDKAIEKISSLRQHGIKLSIDDFGTGYSSITYLKRLPVNHLKIDRSFTQNLHDASNKKLMKMMINMAKAFNLKTVVEGVEDAEQLEYINRCGADIYQGFYCSPAVEKEKFIEILNRA